MAIAVSGGVDSMTLAALAHRVEPKTQIFHAISPAVPVQATTRVKRYAESEGWQLNLIDAGEMQDPQYLANPANRCYFCKTNLYDRVAENTYLAVASGANLDDLGDYRPGLIAAQERGVCHPYLDVGLDKATVRKVAGEMSLEDLKDLPAAPCLSSRVTTGIAIDSSLLPVVNQVEEMLRKQLAVSYALQGLRCRIREGEVAIQLESETEIDFSIGLFTEHVALVRRLFERAGFGKQVRRVVFEPYKKGSAFLIETLNVS